MAQSEVSQRVAKDWDSAAIIEARYRQGAAHCADRAEIKIGPGRGTNQAATGRGILWIVLAIFVFFAWGIQAYFMKFANKTMKAESIFFYMMISGIFLIPIAVLMTDFSQTINWSFKGPYLAAMIQILNSIGALCLVYAFRFGKAIIVSPLTNAIAPVITVIISLVIYMVVPNKIVITGMVLALIATFLMSVEKE